MNIIKRYFAILAGVSVALVYFGVRVAAQAIEPGTDPSDINFDAIMIIQGVSLGGLVSFGLSLLKRWFNWSGTTATVLIAIFVGAYFGVESFGMHPQLDFAERLMKAVQDAFFIVLGNQAFYIWLGHKIEGKSQP